MVCPRFLPLTAIVLACALVSGCGASGEQGDTPVADQQAGSGQLVADEGTFSQTGADNVGTTETEAQATGSVTEVAPATAPAPAPAPPPSSDWSQDGLSLEEDPPATTESEPAKPPPITDPATTAKCADTSAAPHVWPADGTVFEKYASHTKYDNVRGTPIGGAGPIVGGPNDLTTFSKRWCDFHVGSDYQAVYDRLGYGNVRMGRYSVWEVERTRFVIEFTADGKVHHRAHFYYRPGWRPPN